MCLYKRITPKEQKKIKDEITRDGIKVYKVVCVLTEEQANDKADGCFTPNKGEGYYSPYGMLVNKDNSTHVPYKNGIDIADDTELICITEIDRNRIFTYKAGFHFFKDRDVAVRLKEQFDRQGRLDYQIIECTVKKSWITQIGYEGIEYPKYTKEIVFVTKKAIFPFFRGK